MWPMGMRGKKTSIKNLIKEICVNGKRKHGGIIMRKCTKKIKEICEKLSENPV